MSFQDNFTIDAGASFTREFVYKIDGEVVSLTGYLARAQVRRSTFGPLVISSEPTIDPETDVITLSFTAEQTSLLRESNYVYGLQVYNDSTDDVAIVAHGVLTINQAIVR